MGNLRFEAGASMRSKATCTPRGLETLRLGRWKVVERSTANIELIMHVSMLVTGAVHEHKSLVQSCGGLQSRALATQRCGKARAEGSRAASISQSRNALWKKPQGPTKICFTLWCGLVCRLQYDLVS